MWSTVPFIRRISGNWSARKENKDVPGRGMGIHKAIQSWEGGKNIWSGGIKNQVTKDLMARRGSGSDLINSGKLLKNIK